MKIVRDIFGKRSLTYVIVFKYNSKLHTKKKVRYQNILGMFYFKLLIQFCQMYRGIFIHLIFYLTFITGKKV